MADKKSKPAKKTADKGKQNTAPARKPAAKPRKSAKPAAAAKKAASATAKSTSRIKPGRAKAPASKAPASRAATAKPASTRKSSSAKSKAAPAKMPAKRARESAKPSGKNPNIAATAVKLMNPMTPVKAYANFAGKILGRLVPEDKIAPAGVIDAIRKGPQGPGVIAAFDFDGTLIGGYSGTVLYKERKKRKEVSKEETTESIAIMFKTMMKLVEANEMVAHAFSKWEGKSQNEMEELSAHIYENAIQDAIFPEMREILAAHVAAGHTIVVATSASRYQAEPAVEALGIEHLICTELEVKGGKLTGKLEGEALFGKGKEVAIKAFVAERGGSLEKTYFYADGSEEVGLMERVGFPRPVNPGRKLLEAAKTNDWPVLRLSSRGSSKPADFLRSMAGMASIGPVLQTGLLVGAFTRDRRSIANTIMPAWINTQMMLAGVKMRVRGREHLWSRRPAVFIFNHRNFYDGMIAAALVKTDFAAIAREEMGDTAVGKLVQKIMPTVLIKRGTGSKLDAARALEPVVHAMQKEGYSVMLSPEGTRTKGNLKSVGPFKKGAFHMAMAAGVPVVPIVIRNALDIAGHSQGAMRPGTVDVAVLPPISVEDWTPRTMNAKIEDVRQMYMDTLGNFPEPDEQE